MQRKGHVSSGLHESTRFICARTVTVSLDHPAFRRAPDRGTPLIGRLTEPLLDRMNAFRGRLHAEADIAAERRTERRASPRKGGAAARPRLHGGVSQAAPSQGGGNRQRLRGSERMTATSDFDRLEDLVAEAVGHSQSVSTLVKDEVIVSHLPKATPA